MDLVYRHCLLRSHSGTSFIDAQPRSVALSTARLIPAQPVCLPLLNVELSALFISALTGLTSISLKGALRPRQWILERLEEIEDAPADDDIIVEADKSANLGESQRKLITHM